MFKVSLPISGKKIQNTYHALVSALSRVNPSPKFETSVFHYLYEATTQFHISKVLQYIFNFQDKTIAHPQYIHFTKDHQSEFYPLRNSAEEFSISPMGGSAKKLSSSHDTDFVNTMVDNYFFLGFN